MKGIVLAGGSGSRLYPITLSTSKQLLPIYDKPLIYYPLSILMLAGIRDILIISSPPDLPNFKKLLGDGSNFGLRFSYAEQPSPDGLAQAFLIGEEFIGSDTVALCLGDNLFYGDGMRRKLISAVEKAAKGTASIFGYYVNNPSQFGVVEFNEKSDVTSIEEKPACPKSNYAITGLYFFDNRCIEFAKKVKPSKRGELEITDVINQYFRDNALSVEIMGRGFSWFDTGTMESMAEASQFVRMIENHQGIQLSCLEEISYLNNWISNEALIKRSKEMGNSPYGKHLENVALGRIIHKMEL
ncbi:MAG: glucose-1-phosphate thymidylyltransferase RfbA [Bacilli bacterium]|jgi:glucose-1-phosphate thymidylyltransferase